MKKKEVQSRITMNKKNGKVLPLKDFEWDEKNKRIRTREPHLTFDFEDVHEIDIRAGNDCTFRAGNICILIIGDDCVVDVVDYGTIIAGNDCEIDCVDRNIIITKSNCNINCGDNNVIHVSDHNKITANQHNIITTDHHCNFEFDNDSNNLTQFGRNCKSDDEDLNDILKQK